MDVEYKLAHDPDGPKQAKEQHQGHRRENTQDITDEDVVEINKL